MEIYILYLEVFFRKFLKCALNEIIILLLLLLLLKIEMKFILEYLY